MSNKFRLTDEAYSTCLSFVTLFLPGTASICFCVSLIWDDPYTTVVLGLLSILSFLLGIMINVSLKNYKQSALYDGQMVISEKEDGPKIFSLLLYKGPEVLESKESVLFKVNHGEVPVEEGL